MENGLSPICGPAAVAEQNGRRETEAAPVVFEAAQDVPEGGVLLALPALPVLLAVGLLRHSEE